MSSISRTSGLVFGPVPSRRLGRSLGVDLVPYKTCTYNCIYCQLGRTTCQTVERREWVPLEAVLEELPARLSCQPDYITLGGSGEPTLHSRIGEIIEGIRAVTNVPIAVLTNGSLLGRKEVRQEVALADVVLPSLCAPDAEQFGFIHRPHAEITLERLMSGLVAFRDEFSGKYWLEIMLLAGYTALEDPVRQLARWAKSIRPDKIQLNTPERPPLEDYAMAAPRARLVQLARLFDPPAEVIAARPPRTAGPRSAPSESALLTLLQRRPCTLEDVVRVIRLKHPQAATLLARWEARGRVQRRRHGGLTFYRACRPASASSEPAARNPDRTVPPTPCHP
jgi:wyosine [tRNA(Phe)-imidazoG37] synthetase (radical SAM superfamily)